MTGKCPNCGKFCSTESDRYFVDLEDRTDECSEFIVLCDEKCADERITRIETGEMLT